MQGSSLVKVALLCALVSSVAAGSTFTAAPQKNGFRAFHRQHGMCTWTCDDPIFADRKCRVPEGGTAADLWQEDVPPSTKDYVYDWLVTPLKELLEEAGAEKVLEHIRDIARIVSLEDFFNGTPELNVLEKVTEPGCYVMTKDNVEECEKIETANEWFKIEDTDEAECAKLMNSREFSLCGESFQSVYVRGLSQFVDRMKDCNGDNLLLNKFFMIFTESYDVSRVSSEDYESQRTLVDRAREFYAAFPHDKKVEIVSQGMAYAMLLDRVTAASRRDVTILRGLKELFDTNSKQFEDDLKSGEKVNTFEYYKKVLIDMSIDNFLEQNSSGKAPENAGKYGLCANIVEACLEDYRLHNDGNAEAGLAIAFDPPGQRPVTRTGSKWSRLSSDRGATQYFPPLGKLWSDLYQTWNMAFVSHFHNNHMFYAKLFNPAVSCYKHKPEEYLHHRLISLYFHVYYEVFRRCKGEHSTYHEGNSLANQAVTTLWSRENSHSGKMYHCEIRQCDKDHANAKEQYQKAAGLCFSKLSGHAYSGGSMVAAQTRLLTEAIRSTKNDGADNDDSAGLLGMLGDSVKLFSEFEDGDVSPMLSDDEVHAINSGNFAVRDPVEVDTPPTVDSPQEGESGSWLGGWW